MAGSFLCARSAERWGSSLGVAGSRIVSSGAGGGRPGAQVLTNLAILGAVHEARASLERGKLLGLESSIAGLLEGALTLLGRGEVNVDVEALSPEILATPERCVFGVH